MQALSFSSVVLILVLLSACVNQPASDNTPPEDVLFKWQGFVDQDMYDSARVYSTGEALEFVQFLESITDNSDSDRIVSITLLRELNCTIQGDSAVCSYLTKDEIGNDIPDTVIMKRINRRWMVARVYDAGAPPLDSLLEGEENLLFPDDSIDEEYQ
jgi:hypothetical protein